MYTSRKFHMKPEILKLTRKPKSELEIEQLVINDMKKKICNDETNEISFYDI